MWGFFWRGAFWVWLSGALLRMARGIELVVVVRGTAKRAAGIDAGEIGRDASVWSGSWSLLFWRFR
jgi:hypothetical protein